MAVIRWLNKNIEKLLLVIFLTTIIVAMLLQIVMRYFFNNSLAWPEELSRYCFIWFMFIAFSYSIHLNIDLRVDSVTKMLPERVQRILMKLTVTLGLCFSAFIFLNTFKTVSNVYKTGEYSVVMKIPMYYVHSAISVGFGLSTFRYVQRIVAEFKKKAGVV